jgi:short-subunit dehydrogenase
MAAAGHGGILILSSIGSVSGAPYVAQYGATKAFLANLGEALWWELKCLGIDVTVVLPGLTRTPDVEKGLTIYGRGKMKMMEPQQVASLSLNALGKKFRIAPGAGNKFQYFMLARIMPRALSISFFGKIFPKCFRTASLNKTLEP